MRQIMVSATISKASPHLAGLKAGRSKWISAWLPRNQSWSPKGSKGRLRVGRRATPGHCYLARWPSESEITPRSTKFTLPYIVYIPQFPIRVYNIHAYINKSSRHTNDLSLSRLERPFIIEKVKAETPAHGRVDDTLGRMRSGCCFQLLKRVLRELHNYP